MGAAHHCCENSLQGADALQEHLTQVEACVEHRFPDPGRHRQPGSRVPGTLCDKCPQRSPRNSKVFGDEHRHFHRAGAPLLCAGEETEIRMGVWGLSGIQPLLAGETHSWGKSRDRKRVPRPQHGQSPGRKVAGDMCCGFHQLSSYQAPCPVTWRTLSHLCLSLNSVCSDFKM
jgi:hypothetical protein